MANSRIPIGMMVAIIGALLALGGSVLAAEPAPLIPSTTSPPAVIPPASPAHKVPAAIKHTPPPAHAQTQPQTQALIPPAILPNQSSQLGAPPAPRDPLPMETDLLPLGAAPAASTPAKQPVS